MAGNGNELTGAATAGAGFVRTKTMLMAAAAAVWH
jgi:hypothetical protein